MDSSSNSDLDEDHLESDQESDAGSINLEILQERQFEAEIEQYDFVIARAQAVVDRQRQEELVDNDINDGNNSDTDSEMSVLASSLFNGMDGIEYSGTAGIETSGSAELESDDDGNGAPGITFSPRKMRSGKVVGNRDEE
jgi:hypothetical protein